jgi:hypothetical protein
MSINSTGTSDFVKKSKLDGIFSVDNIWKISVLAFMAANLYLQQNYTSRAQFERMDAKVQKIELVLAQLEIKNQIDVTQTTQLQVIDNRIRDLEKTSAVLLRLVEQIKN